MKPRNRKQQEIMAMSGQLRPLTPCQKQWALANTINHFGFRLKSVMCTCMKCGHEWLEERNGTHICPECGSIIYYIYLVTLFQELLTNPKAETLMKTNDIELLRYLCSRHLNKADIDTYWNTIKVANRNGYKVKDSQMWMDYIKMLERSGKDILSPKYICPSNLKEVHDKYVEKVNRLRAKERMEADRKRAEADEAKFEQLKGRYIGLAMTDGNIRLNNLNSVAEYYEEGTKQHICVGSAKYYLKADTLVMRATLGNKTIATVEISLKDYSILQCRAFANGICEYTEQIAGIFNSNKSLIAERQTA